VTGRLPRRLVLLAAPALLGGCETMNNLLGERKVRLPGERRSVLQAEAPLAADAEEAGRVALPPATPIAEWPMTGGTPGHAPGHVAANEAPGVAWRSSAGSGSAYRQRIVTGPVIANGTVFAVDAWGSVSAHALADGRQRWRTGTTPEDESAVPLGGGAAFADGTLYVATAAGEVMALDPASGTIRWRERLPSAARGAPTVAGGRIFIPTIENQLTAHAVEDGKRIWMRSAAPLVTIPLGLPAPAVEGETVVAGFGSGELLALRATDGRVLWSESLGGTGRTSLADIVGITGMPVIAGGRVIALGQANIAIAVDLRSGRRLWERPFGGGAGVAVAGDWAFATTDAGEALAIGREDGRISWVTELDPPPPAGRRGDPARFGPPMVAGGRVLVPSTRGEILQLDPVSGQIVGRIPVRSPVSLPMAAAEGHIVALADDGTLIALR
jgi:outer membrane protein assembly factor BamB